jgi:hypothetical protein
MVILYVLSRAAIDDGRFRVNLTTEGKTEEEWRGREIHHGGHGGHGGEDRGREEETEEDKIIK